MKSPEADAHRRSAVALATFALGCDDLTPVHRRALLHNAIWYLTEAAGKYATRYRSLGVLTLEENGPVVSWRSQLRHDHVVPRAVLVARLLAACDADIETVLDSAVACVVTKSEHARLSGFDMTMEGWDRYLTAGVDVVDMATGRPFIRAGEFVCSPECA